MPTNSLPCDVVRPTAALRRINARRVKVFLDRLRRDPHGLVTCIWYVMPCPRSVRPTNQRIGGGDALRAPAHDADLDRRRLAGQREVQGLELIKLRSTDCRVGGASRLEHPCERRCCPAECRPS